MHVKAEVFDLLLELIKKDDSAALRFFLKWETDRRKYLEYRSSDGLTLLHHACLAGKRNVVHALIDCGADIEKRSSVGWTALHAAALSGCYDVVSYLVRGCAANPLVKDDMGCLPQGLTLEARITGILEKRLVEINTRTMIEKSKHDLLTENRGEYRGNTVPVRRRSRDTKLRSLKRGEIEETKSLPGDLRLRSPRPVSGRMVENAKIDKYQASKNSKRDSGIFDDLSCVDLTEFNNNTIGAETCC
eukprot:gene4618-5224_t